MTTLPWHDPNFIDWAGFPFTILPTVPFHYDRPGVYVFAGRSRWGWEAYYVGIAGDLGDRFSGHEKWLPAVVLGATHVHFMEVRSASERAAIERMLVERLNPPLNKQLRSHGLLADLLK